MENQVVVTRHPALLEYLREQGLCDSAAVVIEHATPDDICGRHVVGVLPLHLAAEAFGDGCRRRDKEPLPCQIT